MTVVVLSMRKSLPLERSGPGKTASLWQGCLRAKGDARWREQLGQLKAPKITKVATTAPSFSAALLFFFALTRGAACA